MPLRNWPSLVEARQSWKFEDDEVILDHVRHWVIKATELGLSSFHIEFDKERGLYVCTAVR